MPLSRLIIAIYRYASSRMATGCHGTRRSARTVEERRRVLGLAECLLFGRAVDRLYLRSGLSSWPCSIWMAKRNEARWRSLPFPRHTTKQSPLLTGEFTIARCSSFIERLTYIAKFAENARRASLWSWILSIVTSSDFSAAGSTQTSTASRLSQSKDHEALGQSIQRIRDLAREI